MGDDVLSGAAVDVVVVGAGPVGAAVASELARCGVRVVVLDRAEEIDRRPKAGLIHARTRQILARRGLVAPPDVLATGSDRIDYHYAATPGVIPLTAPRNDPAPLTRLPQDVVEESLLRLLGRFRVAVLRGVEVDDVVQGPDGVVVRTGARSIRARWVIGCDGSRSVVRERAGITSSSHAPTCHAITGLVETVQRPDALPTGWFRGRDLILAVNPEPAGRQRVQVFGFDDPARRRRIVAPGDLSAALGRASRQVGVEVALRRVMSVNRFSDHARLADTYRVGRSIIAGDAAHVHFPLGAQGMNLGLVDALGLGWRLAAVLAGSIAVAELDAFLDHRRSRARVAISRTRHQALAMRPDRRGEAERARWFGVMSNPLAARAVADELSGHDGPPRVSTTDVADAVAGGQSVVGHFLDNHLVRTGPDRADVSLVEVLAGAVRPVHLAVGRDGVSQIVRASHGDISVSPDGVIVSNPAETRGTRDRDRSGRRAVSRPTVDDS